MPPSVVTFLFSFTFIYHIFVASDKNSILIGIVLRNNYKTIV